MKSEGILLNKRIFFAIDEAVLTIVGFGSNIQNCYAYH